MTQSKFASTARLLAALFAVCLAAAASAQTAAPAQTVPAKSLPVKTPPAARSAANDEMLAKARKLYYSTAKTGLTGFDCTLHPDWHTLFVSADKSTPAAVDDPRIVLLKSVNIVLHARLAGSSTLDWTPPVNPPAPIDADSAQMLKGMHEATEQSLMGFLQFWTPFIDGSAIPDNSEGLTITKDEKGTTLHADQGGTNLTAVIDNQLILRHFNVVMNEATVNFEPTYKPTPQGLLVDGFLVHVQPAGASQTQEMHVSIAYQTVNGFPIPARLHMEVIGSGTFDFAFDGCSTTPQGR